MKPAPVATITKHIANLEDPRVECTKLHLLLDIVVIAVCAVICGADTWVEVESYGKAKQEWCYFALKKAPRIIPDSPTAHATNVPR